MTLNEPEEKKPSVVPYKGFEKRRNRTGSATLGDEQARTREIFGYTHTDYIRSGQGKSKVVGNRTGRRSGKSGGG